MRTLANQTYFGGDSRVYPAAEPGLSPTTIITISRCATRGRGRTDAGRRSDGRTRRRWKILLAHRGIRALRRRSRTRDEGSPDGDSGDEGATTHDAHGAETFVDAGLNANQVRISPEKLVPVIITPWAIDPHFGLGARRAVTDQADLGVRVEVDEVAGHSLIGVRPLDSALSLQRPGGARACSRAWPATMWPHRRIRNLRAPVSNGAMCCPDGADGT